MRAQDCPNLVSLFLARAAERGDAPFLWRKADGAWHATGWADAARTVASLADALRAIGLQPGDRVMLVAENRPEWCLSDLAIMAAGCVSVPTYTTNTPRDHLHILTNSGARAAIVSTAKLATALAPALAEVEDAVLIGIDAMPAPEHLRFHDWRSLVAAYPATAEAALAGVAGIGRGDLACIIYTSGTGGLPRGVRHHHGAILHNVAGTATIIAEDFARERAADGEVFLSFLPLSHAYEHSAGQFLPIGLGGQIFYAENLEKLAANIEEVRPTIMVVVPRLFEVLRTRITRAVEKSGGLPARLFARAIELGERREAGTLRWRDRPAQLAVDLLLKPKLRARFGGRLKALVSGGAPLNPAVGVFFRSIGLTLLQGYGQTEAGPVISCNRPSAGVRMDGVGPPLPDTQVRLADDGEILVRGENVTHGYWRDEAETARAIVGGWLHTGDVGTIDAAGRLRITDRKKDLIVNDKGDNVAPQKVEGLLTLCPEIAQAMVAGDRRPYLVALLVPEPDWLRGRSPDAADVRAGLSAAVDRVNRDLSPAEKVRRHLLADEPFAIANEQLTPSLKIRRHVLRRVYGERLDALYGAG